MRWRIIRIRFFLHQYSDAYGFWKPTKIFNAIIMGDFRPASIWYASGIIKRPLADCYWCEDFIAAIQTKFKSDWIGKMIFNGLLDRCWSTLEVYLQAMVQDSRRIIKSLTRMGISRVCWTRVRCILDFRKIHLIPTIFYYQMKLSGQGWFFYSGSQRWQSIAPTILYPKPTKNAPPAGITGSNRYSPLHTKPWWMTAQQGRFDCNR